MSIRPQVIQDAGEIVIRFAKPDDVALLAELHCRSFTPEQHVPVGLGNHFIRAIFKWILRDDSTYSFVAEEDNRLIGYITVCDHAYSSRMFMACLPDFIMSVIRNPKLISSKLLWKRFLRREGYKNEKAKMIASHPGLTYIMFGAVDGSARGKGVYILLYDKVKEYSVTRGARALRGDVYKLNSVIRRVKEKDHWIEIPELETIDTIAYIYILDRSMIDELNLDYPIK